MWKNYLKISFRSITKHFKISLINIFGLTAGIAGSLIVFTYVNNEISYDKFHKNKDQIYRITTHLNMGNNNFTLAMSTPALGQQIKDEYPEVKNYVRIRNNREFNLKINNESYAEKNLFYADSTFFDIFTYKLSIGNPETVLNAPFSILLTEAKAKKYFGNENPIGKKIIINDEDEFTVTGILKDIPETTQIYCEFLTSYSTIDAKNKLAGNPQQSSFMRFQDDYVYILTEPITDIENLTEKMNLLVDENVPDHLKPVYNVSLMPLKDQYFSEGISGELEPIGNKRYIWIFLTITIILIAIAAINFMNLSTSRYTHRIKEVGMRKVFGAYRKHLIFQFIGESMIITLIALVIGVLTAYLLNPALNNFIGKTLEISFFSDYKLFGFLIFITIFIGFVSGSYPALFLSRFSPQDVFKMNQIKDDSGINLRRILVILQFTLASALIIFTLFIFAQLRYVKTTNLGFNKENLALISLDDPKLLNRFKTFKNEIKSLPEIENISFASSFPGEGGLSMQNIPVAEGSNENLLVQRIETDNDYIETLQLEMLEGRYFSNDFPADMKESIVINETAVKELNLEDPVGKTIPISKDQKRTIIGIMKDFHTQSLRNKISATIFIPRQDNIDRGFVILGSLAIKLKETNKQSTLRAIEKKWKEMFPETEFNYQFLEDSYNNQYNSDLKMGKLFLYFSGLIILISCLGIFGLVSFSIEKRLKEIGIRKILGGASQNIAILLAKQFVLWLSISYLIAIPIVYYSVKKWFNDFAYHINISWHQFTIGILIISVIAITTILTQTLRASRTNPANILRYE